MTKPSTLLLGKSTALLQTTSASNHLQPLQTAARHPAPHLPSNSFLTPKPLLALNYTISTRHEYNQPLSLQTLHTSALLTPHSPQKLGTPSSGHIYHPSKLQACVSVPERAEKSHRKGLNLHTLHIGNRPRTGAHFESLQQSTNPYKDCPCPTATNDFLSRMWSSEQTPLRGARLSPRRASAHRGGGRSPYHH